MKFPEFVAALEAERKNGALEKRCGCGAALPPRVDGTHHTISSQDVCAGCYFDALGDEIDRHPIDRGRPHGGAAATDQELTNGPL